MKKLISLFLCLAMLLSLSSVAFAASPISETDSDSSLGASLWNSYAGLWQKAIENYDPDKTAEWIGDMAQFSAKTVASISDYVADQIGERIADNTTPDTDTSAVADTVESVISGGGKIVSGMIRSGAEIAQQFITRSADILDKIADSSIGKILPGISTQPAKPTINYVAFGDSTSMGYFIGDYVDGYKRTDFPNNADNCASRTYSTYGQFSKYLSDTYQVNGYDLTMTGMRPSELRAILDKDYALRQGFDGVRGGTPNNFCNWHLDYYCSPGDSLNGYTKNNDTESDYDGMHDLYVEKTKNADIITYDLLTQDFGGYFAERFMAMNDPDYLNDYGNDTYAKLMQEEGYPQIAQGAEQLRSKLESLLASTGLPVATINTYLDIVLYCYAHFAINFSATMDQIYTLNPDVQMIVVGPFNTLRGLTTTIAGVKLDIGKLWGYVLDAITAYVLVGDDHAHQYLFADLGNELDLVIDAIARGELDMPANKTVKERICENLGLDDSSYAAVKGNIQKAAAITELPLLELLGSQGNAEEMVGRALMDGLGATASDLDKAMLAFALRFNIKSALGTHPSATGCQEKFAAVKLAFERGYTADGTYLARAIETSEYLTANAIGAIWNIGDSRNNLKTFFTDLFTPVIDLSELIGGLLKK